MQPQSFCICKIASFRAFAFLYELSSFCLPDYFLSKYHKMVVHHTGQIWSAALVVSPIIVAERAQHTATEENTYKYKTKNTPAN